MSILMKMMGVGHTSVRESVANPGGQYSELAVLALGQGIPYNRLREMILDLYKIDDPNM